VEEIVMRIGVPKETKPMENRVALTPVAAETLVRRGCVVVVEQGAGEGSGFSDEEYAAAGAAIGDAAEAWACRMVVKVKEPTPEEYGFLRDDLILFTYLHLAANESLTRALLDSQTDSIAYETVQLPDKSLPLLTPMSEVAGRMAAQVGAQYLEKPNGGRGVLLSGAPGVPPASVVIIGCGVVGANAAKIAVGMGAMVTVFDVNHHRLMYLDDLYRGRLITMNSTEPNIREAVRQADLVIGAVLIPGAKAPRLVTKEMIATMKEGTVVVDVAVDQGGCVETIRATTHNAPTYVVDGVVHYGVANMPGAVPRTSTLALVNQTMPYIQRIADKGLAALADDPALALGLNTRRSRLTHRAVAEAFDLPYCPPAEAL
jgi:alanine dehydrogenase